ncbi:hypothetical protein JNE17039_45320 (plasmid) [Escherichia coli]
MLKEIRRLRTELPNLGKEQIFVRLKPWCEQRYLACPSVSTIGRMIAAADDTCASGIAGEGTACQKAVCQPPQAKALPPGKDR